jgi:hypothetical protein
MAHHKIKTAVYYNYNVNHILPSNNNNDKALNYMNKYLQKYGYNNLNEVRQKYPNDIIETIEIYEDFCILPTDFNSNVYLEINPDIKTDKYFEINPNKHYLQYGIKENRLYGYSQFMGEYTYSDYLSWINKKNSNKIYDVPFNFYNYRKLNINIFLLCYNESALLPHTIKHYKHILPSCKITIYDNESTDNSVEIAKSYGCNVISWNSNNIIDDYKYREIKNNCWKNIDSGWIIVADMDEFLYVSENKLIEEMNNGTTILTVKGIDMIGESMSKNLSDINLQKITKYVNNDEESKYLCFLREEIQEMNYNLGAHLIEPIGNIVYSSKKYYNRHMCNLGLQYLIDKMIKRYERSELMRANNLAIHYINDIEKITNNYNSKLHSSKILKYK